jgi:hypothetical protein
MTVGSDGIVQGWSGEAFNQVPDSDNRIHSDEVAKDYGFTGALVPGVTVSAYLIHPAVVAWGKDWLQRGHAHVTVKSPLYDRSVFDVSVIETQEGYSAQLHSDGRLCAEATVSLPDSQKLAPTRRGDVLMTDGYQAPQATRATMEKLQNSGCLAKGFLWSATHEMATYLRDQRAMPAILRTDGSALSGAYANISFLLGCANRHFAAIARMSPWIHLETRSWNFAAVSANTRLISEMQVVDLFNKKGHEFADCRFNIFDAQTNLCVCTIEQRAIYKMR